MRLEAKKYLYDMQQGTTLLTEFTSAKSFDDYRHDPLLKSAVERQFEIIGEALAKLAKLDQPLATRLTDYRRKDLGEEVFRNGREVVIGRARFETSSHDKGS